MTLKFMTFHFLYFFELYTFISKNCSSRVFGDEFWRPLSFRPKLSQVGQACCEMPRGSFRSRTGRRCASSIVSCMLYVGGISSVRRSKGAVTAFFLGRRWITASVCCALSEDSQWRFRTAMFCSTSEESKDGFSVTFISGHFHR